MPDPPTELVETLYCFLYKARQLSKRAGLCLQYT
jgi:hypothetical protein